MLAAGFAFRMQKPFLWERLIEGIEARFENFRANLHTERNQPAAKPK